MFSVESDENILYESSKRVGYRQVLTIYCLTFIAVGYRPSLAFAVLLNSNQYFKIFTIPFQKF